MRVIYFKVLTLIEIPISCETYCIEQNSFTDKAKCSFTKSSSNKERGSVQLSRKRITACLLLAFWSVPLRFPSCFVLHALIFGTELVHFGTCSEYPVEDDF